MKSVDVRTTKVNGETYINSHDLILKINEHGEKVSSAFDLPEFRQCYELAYLHIIELIELIREY